MVDEIIPQYDCVVSIIPKQIPLAQQIGPFFSLLKKSLDPNPLGLDTTYPPTEIAGWWLAWRAAKLYWTSFLDILSTLRISDWTRTNGRVGEFEPV